jgi:aminoglycoside phosphotransferase (APT) family kinase protein
MAITERARPPVDLDVLATWMYERGVGAGPITNVRKLGGRTQNIVLQFTQSGRDYVLRRPRQPTRDGNDDTMRREARVLAALAGSAVPHPRLIAACLDDHLLGTAFYLMEPVDGHNPVARARRERAACVRDGDGRRATRACGDRCGRCRARRPRTA